MHLSHQPSLKVPNHGSLNLFSSLERENGFAFLKEPGLKISSRKDRCTVKPARSSATRARVSDPCFSLASSRRVASSLTTQIFTQVESALRSWASARKNNIERTSSRCLFDSYQQTREKYSFRSQRPKLSTALRFRERPSRSSRTEQNTVKLKSASPATNQSTLLFEQLSTQRSLRS